MHSKKRLLIIGAGVAGCDVLRDIQKNKNTELNPIGFLDDDVKKIGKDISSVPVLGKISELAKLSLKYKIDVAILALPSIDGLILQKIIKSGVEIGLDMRIVPRVTEIIEGRANINFVRKPNVEDLLGRPVIKSDILKLKGFISKKVVLVTGAAGSIGSEIANQLISLAPKKLILFDWWENGIFELKEKFTLKEKSVVPIYIIGSIQDKKRVNEVFRKYKPDYVFHAAAYKHVPLMEENPMEAIKNNIFGTLNVVNAAVSNRVQKFVVVSTDKAAEPKNIMGATKLITEGIALLNNNKTKFISVRFGNVLDSNGSLIQIFRRQLAHGGPLTVTDKRATRFFMTIPEACQLILKAANIGKGGELFILDMGKPININELAENFITLSGLKPYKDIDIKYIGLRKGEKIHEKLASVSEKLELTSENKVFKSKSNGLDLENLENDLDALKDCVDKQDEKAAINLISKMVHLK